MGRRQFSAMAFLTWLTGGWISAGAKGRSFATVAELRDHVVATLAGTPGVDKVTADPADDATFEIVMGSWSSTGDVRMIFDYMKLHPKDAGQLAERFIAGTIAERDARLDDRSIVAVIRTRDHVEDMPDTLHEPLGADLVILYMNDLPNTLAAIRKAESPDRDLASLRASALENMRRWLPKVVKENVSKAGNLYFVTENTILSPSLLLLDDFWKSISKRFPGDVLIALPRRDQLFIFDDNGDPTLRAGIRRLIDATFEDGFNLLSPMLYARRDGKIVAVPD